MLAARAILAKRECTGLRRKISARPAKAATHHPPTPCTPMPSLRHLAARFLLLAVAGVGSVQAEPHAPQGGDAVLQLLREKGLVQQVGNWASDLVISAMNFLGVPYRNGGNSAESGFDCSGFTRHIFENSLGLVLPRRAEQQAQTAGLQDVQREELRPGDLVFFNTMRRAFSHVGIYVGEGRFIHSPRVGGEVRIEDMRQAYWAQRFNGARRADLPTARAETTTP